MSKTNNINLPSILTEDTHFFKEPYIEQLKPYLGRPYISYSSVGSWNDYKDNFIKEKLVGIKLPQGIYASLGNYVGEAIEKGVWGDNPNGFTGQENLNLNRYRKPNAEYEKLIIIDRGTYIIVGFIDIYYEENCLKHLEDNKTGGKGKESTYVSDDYLQTVLYNYALKGECKTGVNFIRREGSHVNPPLKIGKEQFYIPIDYNEKRVKKALDKVDKTVKEITEIKNVFDKYFK
jgi:hypothetical protein